MLDDSALFSDVVTIQEKKKGRSSQNNGDSLIVRLERNNHLLFVLFAVCWSYVMEADGERRGTIGGNNSFFTPFVNMHSQCTNYIN